MFMHITACFNDLHLDNELTRDDFRNNSYGLCFDSFIMSIPVCFVFHIMGYLKGHTLLIINIFGGKVL